MEEIQDAAKQQQKDAEIIKSIGEQIAIKLEEANEAMEALSEKVSSSAEASEQIASTIDDLIGKVNTASKNMQLSVDSANEQGEIIAQH